MRGPVCRVSHCPSHACELPETDFPISQSPVPGTTPLAALISTSLLMPALQRKIKTATEAAGSDIVKNATASRWPPVAAGRSDCRFDRRRAGRTGWPSRIRPEGGVSQSSACVPHTTIYVRCCRPLPSLFSSSLSLIVTAQPGKSLRSLCVGGRWEMRSSQRSVVEVRWWTSNRHEGAAARPAV